MVAALPTLELLPWLVSLLGGLPLLLSRHVPGRPTFHPSLTPFLLGASLVLLFPTSPLFCYRRSQRPPLSSARPESCSIIRAVCSSARPRPVRAARSSSVRGSVRAL